MSTSSPTDSNAGEGGARRLLASYLRETGERGYALWTVRPADYASGRAILEAEPAVQILVIQAALATLAAQERSAWRDVAQLGLQAGLAWLGSIQEAARAAPEGAEARGARAQAEDSSEEEGDVQLQLLDRWDGRRRLGGLLGQLARRRLPYTTEDMCRILAAISRLGTWDGLPVSALVRSIERRVAACGLAPEVCEALRQARAAGDTRAEYADSRKAVALIDALLQAGRESFEIEPGDDWGDAARQALAAVAPAERPAWLALLAHAQTATAAKPSAAWLEGARGRIAAIGEPRFRARAIAWLDLLKLPPSNRFRGEHVWDQVPAAVPTERNGMLLRGLVWCCAVVDDEALARAVAEAAEACFKKIPELGARSTKVGNACLYALGTMPGPHSTMQLVCLQRQLKQPSARTRLDATMEQAAERAGLTRDDLEDRAVPTHGLEAGRLRTAVGAYDAEIVVRGPRQVDLQWLGADGAPLGKEPLLAVRGGSRAVRDPEQGVPARGRQGDHRPDHHAADPAELETSRRRVPEASGPGGASWAWSVGDVPFPPLTHQGPRL